MFSNTAPEARRRDVECGNTLNIGVVSQGFAYTSSHTVALTGQTMAAQTVNQTIFASSEKLGCQTLVLSYSSKLKNAFLRHSWLVELHSSDQNLVSGSICDGWNSSIHARTRDSLTVYFVPMQFVPLHWRPQFTDWVTNTFSIYV